jgi:tetratricopeptide (TPR) repeat protein
MVESLVSPELAAENQRNLRRLVMSVRASFHKLNLLIAICDNPQYRDELIRTYEAELKAQGTECHQVRLDRTQPSLKQSLTDLVAQQSIDDQSPALVTVLGGDELLAIRLNQPRSAQEQFFFSVQWTREGLREFRLPIVVWVTAAVARGLAQQAPDFWSWRGGVFEFVQPIAGTATGNGQAPDRPYEPEALADPAEVQQQVAALLAEDPNSPLLASLYQSLGVTYYKRLEQGISQDRAQEEQAAIMAFQAAIQQGEAPDNGSLATNLSYLAELYESQGRYSEAEPLLVQALALRQRLLGAEHPDVASSLNNLAYLYESQGRYSEAEPLYVQALELSQRLLGAEHPDVASSLNNLAYLYRSQGRYSEAEPLYVQALELRQRQLGAEHPDVAQSLNNLAGLYRSQGRYSEAEPLLVQALELRQRLLGAEHPHVASSLNNLAYLYDSQGRYSEAEPLYVQALEICERQLGSQHPNTAIVRGNLEWFRTQRSRLSQP